MLEEGSAGEAVVEVRRRLEALGLQSSRDHVGVFGPATRAAVEAFQRRRGLPRSGKVDPATWSVLIEAGHVLGSRPLHHLSPMLRGDDVADLQQRLCALGFDTDRVDGIFGGLTAHAVAEFQENIGLLPDGEAGPVTTAQLLRLGGLSELTRSVTAVRDVELLRSRSGADRFKVVGLSPLGIDHNVVHAIHLHLESVGLTVHRLGGDERTDPGFANRLGVDLYLGLTHAQETSACRTLFYSGYAYESASGKSLASQIMASFVQTDELQLSAVGMALPLLRETLMTAIVVELPHTLEAFGGAGGVAEALAAAITADFHEGDESR